MPTAALLAVTLAVASLLPHATKHYEVLSMV